MPSSKRPRGRPRKHQKLDKVVAVLIPPARSSTRSMSLPTPSSCLLELPVEIRLTIYNILASESPLIRKVAELHQIQENTRKQDVPAAEPQESALSALRKVNRQLRLEISPIFFDRLTFHHSINSVRLPLSNGTQLDSPYYRELEVKYSIKKSFKYPNIGEMKHVSFDYISPYPLIGSRIKYKSDVA